MKQTAPTTLKPLSRLHSLAVKVSLMITGMTLAVMLVIAVTFTLFERSQTTQDIYRNGETFATFSAISIYQNYSQFYTHPAPSDFENFKQNVTETLSHNKDIRHIQLISLNGRVLFSSDEFQAGKYNSPEIRTVEDQSTLDAVAKNSVSSWDITKDGKRHTMITVPLKETGGGHFLSMTYLLSYDSLGTQLRTALAQLAWVLTTLLALVTVGALLFSLSLVRPITRLTRVAERLRTGDLDARAQVTSSDEVGRLALTLNDMADQIKLNIVDLEASRAKIEEQNRTLRQDKVQLQASINSVDIGFIMTDHNDNVVLINAEAERILAYTVTPEGVSKEEPVRHDWTTDTIDQKLSKSFPFRPSLAQARSENTVIERNEVPFNGRVLRLFVAPIVDFGHDTAPQILGSVTLLADITEQKVLERSKEEFFSIASHELRTPLTAIRGNAALIESIYGKALKDNDMKELVTDIHDSSIRLIDIVNDFLDVSRAEQGKMRYELQAFPIDEVINKVLFELGATCKEKGITAQLEPIPSDLPQAYADKNRIKQVVYNLVANAAKFTPQGGSITLSVEKLPDHLKVHVKDTGTGMDTEAQRLLFHKFQQAGNSLYTRNTERGTGLGLYICKLMLEQMNGSIKLESSMKDKGTMFSFTVPIHTGQAPQKIDNVEISDTDTHQSPEAPTDTPPPASEN